MTKYELIKNSREIKYRKRNEIDEGCTLRQNVQYPEVIQSFDDKEMALEALNDYSSTITEFSSNTGLMYDVTEYYVEEKIYDDNGEIVDGSFDICGISQITIALFDEESNQIIDVFNNMKDAVRAEREYDGYAYLSYSPLSDDRKRRKRKCIKNFSLLKRVEKKKKTKKSELLK